VLAVGPRATTPLSEVGRVVVPCDGSSLSEQAIEVGASWADRLGLDLWIVTVIPVVEQPPVRAFEHNYVERLANGPVASGAQWDVLHGDDPARAIAEWADGDLVVMTSHGRSGLSRLTLGSVASGTTRWATGPVLLIVPDGDLDAQPITGDERVLESPT
jgi:nucleotide-binding universal stress UspA family protein